MVAGLLEITEVGWASGMAQQKKELAVNPGDLCLIPQDPCKGGRRDLTPLSCLLLSRCVLWHACPGTHTHIETLRYAH